VGGSDLNLVEGLALFGVRLALVFGVLTFLCNFIPSIGSVIATLLPIPLIVLSTTLTLPEKILAVSGENQRGLVGSPL